MKFWICGQYRSGDPLNTVWDFQGIFSTKEKAIKACLSRNYFIVSAKLDEEIPDETKTWPGVKYPLA